MTRVKRGMMARKRKRALIKKVKGFTGRRGRNFRAAKTAYIKAGQNRYVGRKLKKRDFRSLWIIRVSAALMPHNVSYSKFMGMMKKQGVTLNRKVLSEIAVADVELFNEMVANIVTKK